MKLGSIVYIGTVLMFLRRTSIYAGLVISEHINIFNIKGARYERCELRGKVVKLLRHFCRHDSPFAFSYR